MATGVPVLVAVWCCSVGATWTVELHKPGPGATLGTLVDWMSSGVPTSQPEPGEECVREVLARRGLHLYGDGTAGPCTHSRRSIGYVCGDVEVIALAYRMRAAAATAGVHPVILAAQQIATGFGIQENPVDARSGQRLGGDFPSIGGTPGKYGKPSSLDAGLGSTPFELIHRASASADRCRDSHLYSTESSL